MNANTTARWIEVQVWYLCQNIMNKHSNIMELMNLIDGLAGYGDYPAETVKVIVNELITSRRYTPSEEERILLMYLAKVPINFIKRKTGKSGKTLYKLVHENEDNPRAFYPRLAKEQIIILEKFLDTIKALRGLIIC